ncbi:hypothetical protein P8452_44621 [Trifolium repens]|nr:hypothetical protein P8452_44621 [Trifolium repens]
MCKISHDLRVENSTLWKSKRRRSTFTAYKKFTRPKILVYPFYTLNKTTTSLSLSLSLSLPNPTLIHHHRILHRSFNPISQIEFS